VPVLLASIRADVQGGGLTNQLRWRIIVLAARTRSTRAFLARGEGSIAANKHTHAAHGQRLVGEGRAMTGSTKKPSLIARNSQRRGALALLHTKCGIQRNTAMQQFTHNTAHPLSSNELCPLSAPSRRLE